MDHGELFWVGQSMSGGQYKEPWRKLCSLLRPHIHTAFEFMNSLQNRRGSRLLNLPAEIRNEIYRLLLSYEALERCSPNPEYRLPDLTREVEPPGGENDSIYCQNIRNRKRGVHNAILRVNRQVHGEASAVFATKNNWICVRVNKDEYALELEERGFAVVHFDTKGASLPVDARLSVFVNFKHFEARDTHCTFLMPMSVIEDLPRALMCTWNRSGYRISLRADLEFFNRQPASMLDWMLEPELWVYCIRTRDGFRRSLLDREDIKDPMLFQLLPHDILVVLQEHLAFHRR